MVGVLVRMKLRVLRNSMHGRQLAAVILGGIFGLLLAALHLLVAAVPFPDPTTTVDLLATLYGAWMVGWILAPIASGGGDETLRAEHFVLLPLSPRQLAAGLLVASLAGVAALVSLVAFAGLAVFGLRLGAGAALVGVVFTALQLALVVLVYRVTMAGLGSLLTSRKGKELGILLVALTGMSGLVVNYALSSLGPALVERRTGAFAGVMRALPSGWGADAVYAASTGNWGVVALLLGGMLALLAALVAVWGAVLARTTTRGPFRGAARSGVARVSRRRSLLPATPIGAVTGKELRIWWRDARRRIALFTGLVMAVVFAVLPSLSGGGTNAGVIPFLAVYFLATVGLQTGNMYGFDGSALWHTMVVPGAFRADVRGRQLAWVLLVGPVALVLGLVLPGVTGHADDYPWVLSLVPSMLGAGAGVVLLQSVFAAYALPEQRSNANPFTSNGRPGCATLLLSLAMLLLLGVSTLPVVAIEVAGASADLPALRWAGVPFGIAIGAGYAWWWGNVALRRLRERSPELLQTVSKQS